ncbi:MAG: response regulator transcription factor [Candidatus Binatia bacterium]|jgi:two-component system, NarL family, response regulator DegU
MIRVLVADDHAMFREMLRIALPRHGDIEVVGEADNGQDLVEAIYRCRPNVLLLDYKMPHVKDFTRLVSEVRRRYGATEVVVLSGFASSEIALRAAKGGARGYVLKSTRLQAVGDAIRAAARGGIWIDPNLPREVFDIFQRHTAAAEPRNGGLAQLTRREREVLASVAEGISNRDIARKLTISEKTVKTHLTHIFTKLDVKNRVVAAVVFYGSNSEHDAVKDIRSPAPVNIAASAH